eukprot:765264-Hanusia_phi.AAC.3
MEHTFSQAKEEGIIKEVSYVFDDPDMEGQRPTSFTRQEYEECIRKIMIRYPQHDVTLSGLIAWNNLGRNETEFFNEIGYVRYK